MNIVPGACIRSIHKFRPQILSIYWKRNIHVSPITAAIYHQTNGRSLMSPPLANIHYIHRRVINTPTHKKPDPFHRVYRRARTPKDTNRWMEAVLLALMFGACLFPLGFFYNYYDGNVPITNRKRFLIIPFWLDSIVGTYTLTALGIGAEDDEEDADETQKQTDSQEDTDPYHLKAQKNKGAILSNEDKRVKHIEAIFDTIITKNYLKKCGDDAQYNELTPQMLKKFQEFNWKINIVDKLAIVNAMCVPGGKMIVYTGILKEVVSNDDECAAILCHEIGHALCRHGIEHMQWRLFIIACIYVCLSMIGIDLSWMMDRLLNFGVNVLLQLPMSRKAELEADEVAIYLMEHAGYDLDALVVVMDKLGKVEERIGRVPEVISTHPLTKNRVKILKRKIAKAKELKQNAQ